MTKSDRTRFLVTRVLATEPVAASLVEIYAKNELAAVQHMGRMFGDTGRVRREPSSPATFGLPLRSRPTRYRRAAKDEPWVYYGVYEHIETETAT